MSPRIANFHRGVYWRARDSESDNSKPDAMNAINTQQRILDAVDANFDAQLATTKDFVAISEYPRL
jgi:hypothetical protein